MGLFCRRKLLCMIRREVAMRRRRSVLLAKKVLHSEAVVSCDDCHNIFFFL